MHRTLHAASQPVSQPAHPAYPATPLNDDLDHCLWGVASHAIHAL